MGFYIEDLPTEFNGITMQEADYLADEFLSETPCNRMWDAMRALRDFYETVTSEAVEVADRKTENCSEKPNNSKVSEIPTGSEPQTEHRDCINCESADDCAKCRGFTDEPQTERSE